MLQLAAAIATLANLNLRIEKHGEASVPACDVKLTADIPNSQLDEIHPGLLASLYRHPTEKGHQGDLTAPDPQAMTTPRYPRAKPWATTEDWPGYTLTLAAGDFDRTEVELGTGTLKGISLQPQNGGTVALSASFSCHPDADAVGAMYRLMGQDVDATLTPPAIGDLDRLREEAKKKPEPAVKAEPEGSGPVTDAQAGRAFPDALDGRAEKKASAGANVSTLRTATAH